MIREVRTTRTHDAAPQRQTRTDRRGGSAFRDLFGKGIAGPQSQSSGNATPTAAAKTVTVTTTPMAAAKTYVVTTSAATTPATTNTDSSPFQLAASTSTPAAASTTGASASQAAATTPATTTTYSSPFQPAASTSTPASAAATSAPASQPAVYDATHVPTLEEVFGESPFVADPRGVYNDFDTGQMRTYGFRSMYFATDAAAEKIAAQLGGTVVKRNAILGAGYYTQAQPNNMILLPNGREVNAGFIAHAYSHGYPQSYVDRLIAQQIDPDGGYENLNIPVNIVKNGSVQSWSLSRNYATTDA